jgi:DNA primase
VTDSPTIISGIKNITKQDVIDYYKDPMVRENLLRATGDKPVLTVMQREPGTPIYRRYDRKKQPILLNMDSLDDLAKQRTVEFHATLGEGTREIWVDLDPGAAVSPGNLKRTVKHVDDLLKKLPEVKNTRIVFSGGRGYHVRAELEKELKTNAAKKLLQKTLQPLYDSGSTLVDVPPRGNQIRLDTSTFHPKGSLRAPYSLNATTGLVALPVAREKLDTFNPQADASIKSVLSQKDIGEFAPGIPRDRTTQLLPTASGKNWTLAVQKHVADKAGPHWDLRLVDPETQYAHSWAVPKASFPDNKPRLALQMPTHSAGYALTFGEKGPQKIQEGYGKGTVEMAHKEPVQVLEVNPNKVVFQRGSGDTLAMHRTSENKWLLRKATNMTEKTAFYTAGYRTALLKLGVAVTKPVGMRGKEMSHGEGNRPLESSDTHLPAGQVAMMFQGLPNAKRRGGGVTLENVPAVGDNNAEWGPAQDVMQFNGASPYLSGRE